MIWFWRFVAVIEAFVLTTVIGIATGPWGLPEFIVVFALSLALSMLIVDRLSEPSRKQPPGGTHDHHECAPTQEGPPSGATRSQR